MAITVDWGTRIISVPQSFLTLVGGSVYNLDTEAFKIAINDIEDSEQGIMHPKIINHSTKVTLGGIEYARIIEIINGYTITFENGSYVVNLVGSNNNILDVTNLNSVQVRSNNSAGLINLNELQSIIYQNSVWVDQTNSTGNAVAGQVYPAGSPLAPCTTFSDAVAIAVARGYDTIHVLGSATLDTGDDVSGYKLIGQNAARTGITINEGADTLGCEIIEAFVTGNLDGQTILRNCVIQDLNYINGFIYRCMLNPGTITLGGTSTAHFLDCYSGVPGTGTPTIDMNGATNDQDTPLALRNYNGGIKLIEKSGSGAVSIDLASGQVKIDPSCTNGQIVVRGDGKVVDAVTGENMTSGIYNTNLQLINEVQYGVQVQEVWQRLGLDKNAPVVNRPDGSFDTTDIDVNATIDGNGNITHQRQ
jgi:hypothetical protein